MSKILDLEALTNKLIDLLRANEILAELSEEQIYELARRAHFEERKVGEIIVKTGDPGECFYIILSGQVRIVAEDNGKGQVIGYLSEGEIGGEFALIREGPQIATEEVVVDTILAIFEGETFNWLGTAAPAGLRKLQEQEAIIEKGEWPVFDGQQYNEVIALKVKRHFMAFLANLPGSLMLFILGTLSSLLLFSFLGEIAHYLAGCLVSLGFLSVLYVYFDWRNDDFIITSERAIHIERILFHGETRHEAPLTSVQDVSVGVPGLLAKIFDYSTVKIKTAGAGLILFDGLKDGDRLKDEIFRQRQKAQERVEALNVTNVRQTIREVMGVSPGSRQDILIPLTQEAMPPRPGFKPPRAINFFIPRVKEIKGDTITWRKNIFVFLILVTMPILVGLTLSYLFLAALFGFFPFADPSSIWAWLLLIGWLVNFVWYTYQYDIWRKDEYQVTRTSIIDYKGSPFNLGGEQRRSGTFDVIQNIAYVTPNLVAKLLNVGHVVIETAGTEQTFTFQWVYNPVDVQQEIFKRWLAHKESKIQQDRLYEEQRLVRWIGEFYDISSSVETNGHHPRR